MDTKEALTNAYDRCTVIVPSPFKGGLSTMIEVALMGSGDGHNANRPQYAYRLSLITEGGPVTLIESSDLHGPAMGCWPEPEAMALTVLMFLATDPDDVDENYGSDWPEALRTWNFDYGEGLSLIEYDMNACQMGNAVDMRQDADGRWLKVADYSLTEEQALAFVTREHGLTWLRTGYDMDALIADASPAIDALIAFWTPKPGPLSDGMLALLN